MRWTPLAVAVISLATAQQPTRPGAPVGEVVVVGRKPSPESTADAVKRFVGVPNSRLLARWYAPPCPVVAGLGEPQNRRLTDAMVRAMTSVDVKVGDTGCAPNVFVFVSEAPDALVEDVIKPPRRFFFRDRESEIRRSLKTGRPVRWRLSAEVRLSTGERPKILAMKGSPLPLENADGEYAYTEDHARGDRLRSSFRQDLTTVVMIVDRKRVDGTRFEALGAYLTMASLAQINTDDGFSGIDTIMNLFRDADDHRAGPRGFTSWDRGFLRGLYSLDPESTPEIQRYRIADRIKRSDAKP